MSKRFLDRYLPSQKSIKENRSLRFLGGLLHSQNLWHFNRYSVCRAVAIGLFWAMIPVPFQMIAAAITAIIFRANMPVSIGLVWLTNPLTMPPVFYCTYKVGTWITNTPDLDIPSDITLDWITTVLKTHWQPFYIGSLVSGLVLGFIGFFTTNFYWTWRVRKNWRKRQKLRRAKQNK